MKNPHRGLIEGPMLYGMAALAGLCVASWAATWYLDRKVDAANARTAVAEGALGKEKQAREVFQAAAGACSASVERLRADAKATAEAFAARQATSRARTAAAEAQVAALLSQARPEGLTECQATMEILDAEILRRAARP
jgi:hypothetical protein